MSEKVIGYAQSNTGQDVRLQVEMLRKAGCSVVYTDQGVSGSGIANPGLKEARANLHAGDVLKIVNADRIALSRHDLDSFVTDLLRNHIEFEAIEEPDAAMVRHLCDSLNYGPAIKPETPVWRKIAYRFGSLAIRISGRGAVPQ